MPKSCISQALQRKRSSLPAIRLKHAAPALCHPARCAREDFIHILLQGNRFLYNQCAVHLTGLASRD